MTDLCLSCGLCCDGTLFSSVPVTRDEARRLPLIADDADSLPQRCPHLGADRRCDVYASRPETCQRFVCPLLEAVTAGTVSRVQAVALVQRIQGVVARLAQGLGRPIDARSILAELIQSSSWRREHPDLALDAIELERLGRHFLPVSRDGQT